MSQHQSRQTVTLFGNLGQDPTRRQTRQREVEYSRYDAILDDVVTQPYTKASKTFSTFTIAVKNPNEPHNPRWIPCIDWTGQTNLFRKGDRVRLVGSFQLRIYTDRDGQEQRVRQLVIQEAGLERTKIRPATRELQEQAFEDAPTQDDPAAEEIPF